MDRIRTLRSSYQAQPWLFLALTLGLTWLFEFTAAAVDAHAAPWVITALRFAGGVVPLAVAVGLAYLKHDRAFQRDYWRRVFDFRRIRAGWYAVILLYTPVKSGLAALIDVLLGGEGIAPEALARFIERPILILPTLVFWLFFGPVPEEPGWRGYALDGLQARRDALSTSLVLGTVWALWHLPLFFISETWQVEQVGLLTQRFWLYMASLIVEAIVYTWIYNNTNHSTLSAILFHFVVNGFGELFALSPRAEVTNFALGVLAALLVIIIWGPRTLAGRRKDVPI